MLNKEDSNWWEFYGLRYAQGTVFGAMIVYWIFSQNKELSKLLFIPSDPNHFAVSHLILLAIYGLTFCYISSAPILVLHAARCVFFENKINKNAKLDSALLWRLPFVFVFALAISIFFQSTRGGVVFNISESTIMTFGYSLVVSTQFVALFFFQNSYWKLAVDYSKKLAQTRPKDENLEFVESYRHLREHGNSFLIVVFQIILAIHLYFLPKSGGAADFISNLVLAIFIWILPASLIWMVGIRYENELLK